MPKVRIRIRLYVPQVRVRIRVRSPFAGRAAYRLPFNPAKWEALEPVLARVSGLVKVWLPLHRRDALFALGKASILLAALWEYVMLWHTYYYSKRYSDLPISLGWSLLAVISGITLAQAGFSAALKVRNSRMEKSSATIRSQLTVLLAAYISGEQDLTALTELARTSPPDFEECVTAALIGTRGFALERICKLESVSNLRDGWIAKSRKGGNVQRRHSVERLSLLRDSKTIMALEVALEDANPGVVAAAIRGLLRMPTYPERDELIRSLPSRPYLVRLRRPEADGERQLRPVCPVF